MQRKRIAQEQMFGRLVGGGKASTFHLKKQLKTCNIHYKKTRFFLLEKLVKRYLKWPLSDLTKVPSWTSRLNLTILIGFFIGFLNYLKKLINNIKNIYDLIF